MTVFDALNALFQSVYRLLNLADDLEVQLQGVAISEEDRIAPVARLSLLRAESRRASALCL